MNIWDKTTTVTPEMVQRLIYQHCNIKVIDIKLLGQGFDNTAFLINNEMVFRFPHREQARMLMENEVILLPYLASKVSFPLPKLVNSANPSEEYLYPFAGYKIVPGMLLSEFCCPLINDENFARALGSWLQELHSLPVLEQHVHTLKGENAWRLNAQHRTQRVRETLEQYHSCFEANDLDPVTLMQGMNFFKYLDTSITTRHYVHGDLYSKHILVNEQSLPSGLIDWGDAHIGHPALDLGIAFMIFTDSARQAFFDAYGYVDQNWKDIAHFRAYFHPILSLPYFIHEGDAAATAWAKAAIINSL